MSDLQSLARQKADAAMNRRIQELPMAIQALQNKLAAQGGLRSGRMLKQVLTICKDALQGQSTTLGTEYRWAVSHALLASQSWIERLILDANSSIEPLYEACAEHIKRAVALSGGRDLTPQLLAELKQSQITAQNEIALTLRSAFAEKRRGLVRASSSSLVRVISKLFGGGRT